MAVLKAGWKKRTDQRVEGCSEGLVDWLARNLAAKELGAKLNALLLEYFYRLEIKVCSSFERTACREWC
jgi:DNA-binding response OmpR family regulator